MTRVNVGVRAEMKEDIGGEEAASIYFVKLWANKLGAQGSSSTEQYQNFN